MNDQQLTWTTDKSEISHKAQKCAKEWAAVEFNDSVQERFFEDYVPHRDSISTKVE